MRMTWKHVFGVWYTDYYWQKVNGEHSTSKRVRTFKHIGNGCSYTLRNSNRKTNHSRSNILPNLLFPMFNTMFISLSKCHYIESYNLSMLSFFFRFRISGFLFFKHNSASVFFLSCSAHNKIDQDFYIFIPYFCFLHCSAIVMKAQTGGAISASCLHFAQNNPYADEYIYIYISVHQNPDTTHRYIGHGSRENKSKYQTPRFFNTDFKAMKIQSFHSPKHLYCTTNQTHNIELGIWNHWLNGNAVLFGGGNFPHNERRLRKFI